MYGYPYSPCCFPPPYPVYRRPGVGAGWLYGLVVILFILLLLGGGHWWKHRYFK